MQTNINDLDKIVKLNNGQVILVASKDGIGEGFNIGLVTEIAIKQKISTAFFVNRRTDFIDIRDKILSNYYMINISEITDYRLVESWLAEEIKWKNEEYVTIDSGDLKLKVLSKENQNKLKIGYEKINKSNLYIDDTTTFTLNEFKARCRKLKKEKNIKLVVINDLEIIKAPKVSIYSELMNLSRKLNIVIIVAYSPKIEDIELKVPLEKQINDIQTIVKNIDIIIYVEESSTELKLLVMKNNSGDTGIIETIYIEKFLKFVNKAKDK